MGAIHPRIDDSLRAWIAKQRMFFVATAPLAAEGLLNCSPKGLDSLRVLDDHTLAYLDLTGSGIETIAHLKENGRIIVMLCAFEGPPKILRLYGKGEVVHPGHAEFATLAALFPAYQGVRSVIRIAVERIADSCGYAVPLLTHQSDREGLLKWAEKKGPEGVEQYQRAKNTVSLDGLPGADWLK